MVYMRKDWKRKMIIQNCRIKAVQWLVNIKNYIKKWQRGIIVFITALVLVIGSVLMVLESTERHHVDEYLNYGVMVDAGSSGSRILIYTWKYQEGEDQLPLIALGGTNKEPWIMKIEPGLSSYSRNVWEVKEHLEPLLKFAKSKIPKRRHQETEFYVYATAGMRLLEIEKQKSIMKETCKYIEKTSMFNFQCEENAKVISGESEGLYGWVAVNYMLGALHFSHNSNNQSKKVSSKSPTFGFLDLGGASVQIAYEPDKEAIASIPSYLLKRIRLYGAKGAILSEYDIYVSTFLGYGTNTVQQRYLDSKMAKLSAIVEPLTQTAILYDSCFPKNFEKNIKRLQDDTKSFVIKGDGNFSQCTKELQVLLNQSLVCSEEPCALNGVHRPLIDFTNHRFIGVSEFWYTSHEVYGLGGIYQYDKFLQLSEEFCSTLWQQTVDRFNPTRYVQEQLEKSVLTNIKSEDIFVPDLSRLESQCFKAAWLLSILHDGYGFPKTPLNNSIQPHNEEADMFMLKTINQIDGYGVSWALGALILNTRSHAPDVEVVRRIGFDVIFFILMLSISMIVLGIFVYHRMGISSKPLPIHDIEDMPSLLENVLPSKLDKEV